jgi:predicted phage terminase large subunit-like protein
MVYVKKFRRKGRVELKCKPSDHFREKKDIPSEVVQQSGEPVAAVSPSSNPVVNENALAMAIRKAKTNLVLFRRIVLSNGEQEVAPAAFHHEWSDILLEGKENVAIEGFRESGKDQILRAFRQYVCMFPNRKRCYIVVIRNNDTQATKDIESTGAELFSNPLLKARVKKTLKKTANVISLEIEGDAGLITVTIEGYGKGASIRGLANVDKRPDILIANDLQDLEDSQSDAVLEKDWNWFLSDVMFLGQYTRIFLIGNNLGDKCIIERVMTNHLDLGFKTYRIPIMSMAEDGTTVSTWGSKYTVEAIMKERQSYERMGKLDIWLRERMCLSAADETRLFHESDYRYFTASLCPKIAASARHVIATLDPASSKKDTSCFRAISVVAVMEDGHWYLMDMPYGRWDSAELINMMFDVVMKWGIRSFGVEKGMQYQTLEPFIVKEMTRRNCRFNLQPLEHGKLGSKSERISMLQPRFKSGSVWFPQDANWLVELKMELAGVVRAGTQTQLKSAYADLMDSLAMVEQMVTTPLTGVPAKFDGQAKKMMPRRALMGLNGNASLN